MVLPAYLLELALLLLFQLLNSLFLGVFIQHKGNLPPSVNHGYIAIFVGISFLQFDAWQFPTLTWGDPTLPSALRRFTSEFGMGSGGTTALVPPGKFFVLSMQFFILRTQL